MAKYLKKFENHTAYETAESGLILPNVSICVTEGDVHYNPAPPTIDGHEYVDLGLPSGTKWAKYNLGATSETDYGNYYQYGRGGDIYQVTSAQSGYYTGTEDPLSSSLDAATQTWGGNWHMPTKTQMRELTANTTYEWIKVNNVRVAKFTAQNGNYILLPAAGFYNEGNLINAKSSAFVWTSSPHYSGSEVYDNYATYIGCVSDGRSMTGMYRYLGMSVRPVVG